jgi:hypothetical protein
VEVGTVYRYMTETRARLKAGLHLRPMDIPLPDAEDPAGRRRPRWSADGPVAEWIDRTGKDQP